jgi:hypothetical protein
VPAESAIWLLHPVVTTVAIEQAMRAIVDPKKMQEAFRDNRIQWSMTACGVTSSLAKPSSGCARRDAEQQVPPRRGNRPAIGERQEKLSRAFS